MDGAEKGKHYDKPQMEYYKVEAVSSACLLGINIEALLNMSRSNSID